ncbi:hypothetical protein SmJEL517_g05049 [Synchytrium microbalum]|uniref:RRM domain-containing protein n=1 Tax=Synchytrium microbalum TaxID=1806994 RepID=A0A507BX62_9FUNG|nr:uncharacterized protein SmJEL517_g05049 [Synchytrium microbalum]TPX31681.1 hypothetical protein SmJEL517_g05049 [Synchytrium microbalum]
MADSPNHHNQHPPKRQHLFSPFNPPAFSFLDPYIDTQDDGIIDPVNTSTIYDSPSSLLQPLRDLLLSSERLEKPRSSRFPWLEPQNDSDQANLSFPSLPQTDALLHESSLSPHGKAHHETCSPGNSANCGSMQAAAAAEPTPRSSAKPNLFQTGQATPHETPNRPWPRESLDGSYGVGNRGRSRSSPHLARTLFTPPFTPRLYSRSGLSDDGSPRGSSSIHDYIASLTSSIQDDVEFPINDTLVMRDATRNSLLPSLPPSRIVIIESVDEDVSFDELRSALMTHGEIRHLSIYGTTCICVYYHLGAAVDCVNHLRKYGLAHQQVTVAFGNLGTLRKIGPVPEDVLVNQGTLIVWNYGGGAENLLTILRKCGEVKSIEDHELCPKTAFVLEFYDIRNAKRALEFMQLYQNDVFVEYKDPLKRTWIPSTDSSSKSNYFSPSLLDLDLEPLFYLSPDTRTLSTSPTRTPPSNHDGSSSLEFPDTPRRLSRPRVPNIVTSFDQSPLTQRSTCGGGRDGGAMAAGERSPTLFANTSPYHRLDYPMSQQVSSPQSERTNSAPVDIRRPIPRGRARLFPSTDMASPFSGMNNDSWLAAPLSSNSFDSPISPLLVSPRSSAAPVMGQPQQQRSGSNSSSSGSSAAQKGDFDLERVVAGRDSRTTFMIKNIPNKYTQQMLIDFLNDGHLGEFDFLYLRIDFLNRCNVGYAFINFVSTKSVIAFAERVVGKRWPRFNSTKICTLSYAKVQGLDSLIRKFRDSSVMLEEPAFRPKLFHTEGSLKGQERDFPAPTAPLRPSSRGLFTRELGYVHTPTLMNGSPSRASTVDTDGVEASLGNLILEDESSL